MIQLLSQDQEVGSSFYEHSFSSTWPKNFLPKYSHSHNHIILGLSSLGSSVKANNIPNLDWAFHKWECSILSLGGFLTPSVKPLDLTLNIQLGSRNAPFWVGLVLWAPCLERAYNWWSEWLHFGGWWKE
jgi:hypothetical protein